MLPCPASEVWLLCAVQEKYQSCDKLETESPHSGNIRDHLKKRLKNCLAAQNKDILDLPKLIQNKEIDCLKIKMPSYNDFSNSLQNAVKICAQGCWCMPLPASIKRACSTPRPPSARPFPLPRHF